MLVLAEDPSFATLEAHFDGEVLVFPRTAKSDRPRRSPAPASTASADADGACDHRRNGDRRAMRA